MKGFLKSKLVLTIAAFLMVAAAITIPLSISLKQSHSHAHAASSTPILFNAVQSAFYVNPNDSGTVDFTTATHSIFSQNFSNIAFNPPTSLQNCSNSTGVDENKRPFTDVVQNPDGSCATIIAQDSSGDQAGVGNLTSFETKFVATLTVPSAGQLTTNILADDGWIFCMENETNHAASPTPAPNNIMTNPVAVCPGLGALPEMGDNNVASAPTPHTITMNLPTAGTYGVELDYTECCGGQLTLNVNNSFTPTANREQAFFIVQGIDSHLTAGQSATGEGGEAPIFFQDGGIVSSLKNNGYQNAHFLTYSYKDANITKDGRFNPLPYSCEDTFTSTLLHDVITLHSEIALYLKHHPNTDVYLIGHSLGGVLALGELAYLDSKGWPQFPQGGPLKGVITLDSPIGGVPDSAYSFIATQLYHTLCSKNGSQKLVTLDNLVQLFSTAKNSNPQGGKASLEGFLEGGHLPNQQLAQKSLNHGIAVLTVGNKLDFIFDPNRCTSLLPNFLNTQWLDDLGPASGIYGRDFKGGTSQCTILPPQDLLNNHLAVLTDPTVQEGIVNFLPSGGTPLPLGVPELI